MNKVESGYLSNMSKKRRSGEDGINRRDFLKQTTMAALAFAIPIKPTVSEANEKMSDKEKADKFVEIFDKRISDVDFNDNNINSIFNKILFDTARQVGIKHDVHPASDIIRFLIDNGYIYNGLALYGESNKVNFFLRIVNKREIQFSDFDCFEKIIGYNIKGIVPVYFVDGPDEIFDGTRGQFNEILINKNKIVERIDTMFNLVMPMTWDRMTIQEYEKLTILNETWHAFSYTHFKSILDSNSKAASLSIDDYIPTMHQLDEFLSDTVSVIENPLFLCVSFGRLVNTLKVKNKQVIFKTLNDIDYVKGYAGYKYLHIFLIHVLEKYFSLEEIIGDDLQNLEKCHKNNGCRQGNNIINSMINKLLKNLGENGLKQVRKEFEIHGKKVFQFLVEEARSSLKNA